MPKRYIRGKFAVAACNLMDELNERGIPCTVGYGSGRREKRLFVHVYRRDDLARLPEQYGEFLIEGVVETPPDFIN